MIDRVDVDDFVDRIRKRGLGSERCIVGICGPPGSGKSTLTSQIASELDAVVVPMDGFHLPNSVLDDRGLRSVKGAPHTFDADAFVETVRRLRHAEAPIAFPSFDRLADAPVPDAVSVAPADSIVLVEGNYLLLADPPWCELRNLFDLTAFVDLDDDVRVERLIDRHIQFGRSPDEARNFVLNSDETNAALVDASRHRADVVVSVA